MQGDPRHLVVERAAVHDAEPCTFSLLRTSQRSTAVHDGLHGHQGTATRGRVVVDDAEHRGQSLMCTTALLKLYVQRL